jgi:hypothetical protein
MADNNKGEENTSRGNEWEVVLLTESTYAAAPSPRNVESENYDKSDNSNGQNRSEFSDDLINSRHFEAVETRDSEILPIHEDRASKGSGSKMVEKEVGKSSGKDVDLIFKGLDVPDENFGIQQFEKEKGIAMSIHDTEFEYDPNMQGSDLNDKERDMYSLPAFNDESALVESTANGENTNTIAAEPDPSELGLDSSLDISQSSMPAKDGKFKGSDNLPCEAWWKSKAASLYAHAKETNTFWSIFIAAAVMGIVILGKKWQQDKWQTMQIKRQSSTSNERTGRITLPISRLKNVLLNGHSRGSFVRSNANEMN